MPKFDQAEISYTGMCAQCGVAVRSEVRPPSCWLCPDCQEREDSLLATRLRRMRNARDARRQQAAGNVRVGAA